MIMIMGMTKRIQIPVTEAERQYLKAAAQKANLPLAEWARRELRRKADEELGLQPVTCKEALEALFALEGPVSDVETMIEESTAGRLR
jgi:type II secretory pathway component PulK